MKKFLVGIGLLLVAFGVTGCGKEVLPDQIEKFIAPSNVIVEVGETMDLGVKYEPNNAISNETLYYSKNEQIATVNGIGELVGKSVGETKIEVVAKRGKAKTEIVVRVVNKGEKPIKLTNNDVEINKGDNNVVFTIKSNDATKKISSDVTIKFITKNTVSTLVLDERKREILKVLDLRFDAKYLDYEVGNNTKLYNDLEQGGVTVEVIGKTGIKEKSVIKVK